MATTDLIGAHERTTPAAIPLPSAFPGAPYPTAPLPPAAVAAMARLSAALPSTEAVACAVARHRSAQSRIDELNVMNVRDWSGANFLALGDAQATMKASRQMLADAGLLHLIGGA